MQSFDNWHLFSDHDGNWKFDIEEMLLVCIIEYIGLFWLLDVAFAPASQPSPSPSPASSSLEATVVSSRVVVTSHPLGRAEGQQQQQSRESLAEVAHKQDSFQELLQRQQAFEQQAHASIEALQQEVQLLKGRIAE